VIVQHCELATAPEWAKPILLTAIRSSGPGSVIFGSYGVTRGTRAPMCMANARARRARGEKEVRATSRNCRRGRRGRCATAGPATARVIGGNRRSWRTPSGERIVDGPEATSGKCGLTTEYGRWQSLPTAHSWSSYRSSILLDIASGAPLYSGIDTDHRATNSSPAVSRGAAQQILLRTIGVRRRRDARLRFSCRELRCCQ